MTQLLTMSERDIDRHTVIKRFIRKEITRGQTAELLRLTCRQITRLKGKVLAHGAAGLIHGNRGRRSHNRIGEKEQQQIISLLHRSYADFGPTFAAEKLKEQHGLERDPKTIRSMMIREGLWKTRSKRRGSEHRQWRARRSSFGEMEQFDGSYEYWFEDRGESCCLLAAIDDATGRITKIMFAQHEGVFPVFTFWKAYLEEHGRPRSIYLDKFSTYKMNSAVATDNHDLLTQFERACGELRIEPIRANSPQAKGRVERLFQTIQDRLIKELRLSGISTVEEANRFLKDVFVPKFNKQFAVHPAVKGDAHRPLTLQERQRLSSVFSRQHERTVHNDFTIAFKNQWHQLLKKQPVIVCKKDKVVVEERLDGSIWIRLRGKYLNYEVLPERPKRARGAVPWVIAATQNQPRAFKEVKRPAADHPWRQQATAAYALKALQEKGTF